MTSVVGICNMALGNIGITQTIENIDDNNERARVCKLYYEATRDQVIRAMSPNFAQAFVALAVVTGDPPPGWAYQYRYPTDCLYAHQITDVNGSRVLALSCTNGTLNETVPQVPSIPYTVMSDQSGSGRIIATDQEDAVLWYVRRVTDTNDFDPEFVMAMAWALAANIAIPMKVNANVAQFAATQARSMLGEAATGTMSEQQERDERQSVSVTGRL